MVKRVAQGDEHAFLTLYDCYVGRVHALTLRILGNPVAGEGWMLPYLAPPRAQMGPYRSPITVGRYIITKKIKHRGMLLDRMLGVCGRLIGR